MGNLAHIDFLSKKVTLHYMGRSFNLELKEEPQLFKVGDDIYSCRVFIQSYPDVFVEKYSEKEDIMGNKYLSSEHSEPDRVFTIIIAGSIHDIVPKKYPNGYISYMETYGLLVMLATEKLEEQNYGDLPSMGGKLSLLSCLQYKAMDFEENTKSIDWDDSDKDWESMVM